MLECLDIITGNRFKACCQDPTCHRLNPTIMKLENGHCDNCMMACRDCPPSEGYPHEELALQNMVAGKYHGWRAVQ